MTRYAVSGLGRRATTTYLPWFREHGGLVAVVDADPGRLAGHPAAYRAAEFDDMLRVARPDVVVLCGPDDTHHEQILAALAADVSVLVEKPMVLTAEQAWQVVAAERQSRGTVRVAHNFRFVNAHLEVRRQVAEGRIGRVTAVRFAYHLRPGHGASYFRRWHRRRAASGGLEVTKSCHHFDLVAWWLQDTPVDVVASTSRSYYLAESPHDVPDDADIDDTVFALVRYARGTTLSYSLVGCAPWEGYQAVVYGTDGTIAVDLAAKEERPHVIVTTSLAGDVRRVVLPREAGRHAGADARMCAAAFLGAGGERLAGAEDGAWAVALGEAVSTSAREGVRVVLERGAVR
ncbi:MAG: Gfo/Idh/MocA family oxidoreductase [Saccharothrix sp.]|nr:Gfo/Idh/MocA family oxidoreductase [Saccharothrix sp.]